MLNFNKSSCNGDEETVVEGSGKIDANGVLRNHHILPMCKLIKRKEATNQSYMTF